MTPSTALPQMSVVIPTRNRAERLARVLADLAVARAAVAARIEIIIVDNGSCDTTAELIARWQQEHDDNRTLHVAEPGRSRALNCALPLTRAALISFTDDDVSIPPRWMEATLTFFAAHPQFKAAMGRMLLPPGVTDDPQLVELIELYRTVPCFDRGDQVCRIEEFYGANVTIRREVFDAIGGFDERLGVGASGNSEDFDFADRMQAAGMMIGYNPAAVIFHEVDRSRLTPGFHAQFQRRLGASEALRSGPGFAWRSALRAIEALAALGWFSVFGPLRRRTHARGRLIRHSQALRTLWQRRRA